MEESSLLYINFLSKMELVGSQQLHTHHNKMALRSAGIGISSKQGVHFSIMLVSLLRFGHMPSRLLSTLSIDSPRRCSTTEAPTSPCLVVFRTTPSFGCSGVYVSLCSHIVPYPSYTPSLKHASLLVTPPRRVLISVMISLVGDSLSLAMWISTNPHCRSSNQVRCHTQSLHYLHLVSISRQTSLSLQLTN